MRKLNFILPFLCLLFLASCEKNQAPQVINIQSLTDIIVGGSEVIIEVDANDTDEDALTYTWSCDGGEFISSTDTTLVKWKAPLSITDTSYDIIVEISDGELTVSEMLVITVEGAKFIDLRDDNIYEFVEIGTQTWMAENLAYLPEVSPSTEGSKHEPYYYVYDYEGSSISEAIASDYYSTDGVLYNYDAAIISCPIGWSFPSDDEWKELEKQLGMSLEDVDRYGVRNTGKVGLKLKSIFGWKDNGHGTNSSGFNALPVGICRSGGRGFSGHNEYVRYWALIPFGSDVATYRTLTYAEGVFRANLFQDFGHSVRCLKDE
ncbi:FISUMP domain-containing protein [Bacteroidota bacterium]